MIEARLVHAPAIAVMHHAAFPEDPWTTDTFLTLLSQPGMLGLVDERGGFLILRIVADEAEIITLGVTARRQGIGRDLMAAAIARAGERLVVKLHLEVAASNEPARRLYEGLGFAISGRRPNYYADGSDALTMTLENLRKKI